MTGKFSLSNATSLGMVIHKCISYPVWKHIPDIHWWQAVRVSFLKQALRKDLTSEKIEYYVANHETNSSSLLLWGVG